MNKEIRTFKVGSQEYTGAIAGLGLSGFVADTLTVVLEYNPMAGDKDSSSFLDRLLANGKNVHKDIGVPPAPDPFGNGTHIGDKTSVMLNCATVRMSTHENRFADITYHYEWRYTRDSDNDGFNDSDPAWVVVDMHIKFLETQDNPIPC